MKINWEKIWSNKAQNIVKNLDIKELLKLNGHDSINGTIKEQDWLRYQKWIYKKLDLKANDSIFEVGCGCGAFLIYFSNKGHKVGGIDYSKNLLNVSKKILKKGHFETKSAIDLDPGLKYDIILANSVFHYFPDKLYAKTVTNLMFRKAIKKVAILDLCKISYPYNKNHLTFDLEFFKKIGLENNFDVKIFDQKVYKNNNSKFRFNVTFSVQ